MTDDPVDGETDQTAETERALAVFPLRPVIGNADLRVALSGDVAAQVRAFIAVLVQQIEHAAVDEPEVAGVIGQIIRADAGEERVKYSTCDLDMQRLFARAPNPVYDFVSGFPMLYELENELRGILQVAIDLYRGVPARQAITGQDRPLKPEIPGQAVGPDPTIAFRDAFDTGESIVRAAVVGEYELPLISI